MQTHLTTELRKCDWCGKSFRKPPSRARRAINEGRQPPHFCSQPCYHAGRSPLGFTRKAGSVESRFWSYVEKTETCWLWTGTLTANGYGRLRVGRKKVLAHRLAYELTNGPIPVGIRACHDCDKNYPVGDTTYRRCVRPDHLFLGTDADNMADSKRKGRNARGERGGMARFTEAQILEMRRRYKVGGVTQRKLAAEYGTSQTVVWGILSGRTWKHLPF